MQNQMAEGNNPSENHEKPVGNGLLIFFIVLSVIFMVLSGYFGFLLLQTNKQAQNFLSTFTLSATKVFQKKDLTTTKSTVSGGTAGKVSLSDVPLSYEQDVQGNPAKKNEFERFWTKRSEFLNSAIFRSSAVSKLLSDKTVVRAISVPEDLALPADIWLIETTNAKLSDDEANRLVAQFVWTENVTFDSYLIHQNTIISLNNLATSDGINYIKQAFIPRWPNSSTGQENAQKYLVIQWQAGTMALPSSVYVSMVDLQNNTLVQFSDPANVLPKMSSGSINNISMIHKNVFVAGEFLTVSQHSNARSVVIASVKAIPNEAEADPQLDSVGNPDHLVPDLLMTFDVATGKLVDSYPINK